MRILFIVPKFNFTKNILVNKKNYNYLFPLGMAYIISVLKKAKYDVDCINLNHIEGHTTEIITRKLNSKRYDFVCTGDMSNGYSLTELLLKAVREHPTHPKTILGGLIITSEPETIFEALKPDFGVIGEGEQIILELLNTLKSKKSLSKVKGIVYREGNKIVYTGRREDTADLDSIPFPDLESMGFREYLDNLHPNFWGAHLLNIEDYPRPYPIMGSRSCPFNCTFCGHISRYRQRSIDNIMKEIEENVEKYKINMIFLYDDCFTLKLERVYEFCERITNLQKRIGRKLWWGTNMTVKQVTPELLKLMKDAGCYSLGFGFESYDEEVLKSMRKPITPAEIDRALKYSRGIGMIIYAGFIFGDIAETKESSQKTLNYWIDIQKKNLGFINLGFIQPFPGTALYQYCLQKGLIKDKLEFLKNVESMNGFCINMTKAMSDKDLKDLEKNVLDAIGRYKKFVSPKKIIKTNKGIYDLDICCPYCKKEMTYKNNLLKNIFSFGFIAICRNCGSGFWITSRLQKWAYKHYNLIKKIRAYRNKIKSAIGKKLA